MLFTIKVEKEDVVTSKIGVNYQITSDKLNIIFSKDAIEELIADYNQLVAEENKTSEK